MTATLTGFGGWSIRLLARSCQRASGRSRASFSNVFRRGPDTEGGRSGILRGRSSRVPMTAPSPMAPIRSKSAGSGSESWLRHL